MYKFLRDVISQMIKIQDFCGFIFQGSSFSSICIVIVFEDLIFVDDKLSAKTAKITSLENLYVYGILHYKSL